MEKEKWINEVFNSLEGSQKAKPPTDLFAKIENQLDSPAAKIIPFHQWRLAAAAAVLLLILNVFTLRQYTSSTAFENEESSIDAGTDQSLISNYNLYDL